MFSLIDVSFESSDVCVWFAMPIKVIRLVTNHKRLLSREGIENREVQKVRGRIIEQEGLN